MEKKELIEGEEYLTVGMTTAKALDLVLRAIRNGEEYVNFAMFKNSEHQENNNKPHYKNGGMTCFINKKKSSTD